MVGRPLLARRRRRGGDDSPPTGLVPALGLAPSCRLPFGLPCGLIPGLFADVALEPRRNVRGGLLSRTFGWRDRVLTVPTRGGPELAFSAAHAA